MVVTDRLLVIERDKFRLTLYDLANEVAAKYDILAQYPIAVGAKGYRTPRGMYRVTTKAKDPDWRMPDSEWIPAELRGTIIPGGDVRNPIKARWLGVTERTDGIGIHGTGEDWSIGSAASHGCVRMLIPDVIELFDLVQKGCPIYVV